MAVVQYTFTHKQYTEQHNETEYPNGTYITIRIRKLTKEYINLIFMDPCIVGDSVEIPTRCSL